MKKAKKQEVKAIEPVQVPNKFVRNKRKTILLNTMENEALDAYFKKYKVQNKSRFMRETLMRVILNRFANDYPTLWDQPGVPAHLRPF
ncbi:MAG TPA: hypothetical protein PK252_03370 [Bacteroidales bacterium]|nr:hypothetical protein [Bacteroidales bacterium]